MLKRKIEEEIFDWFKNDPDRALCIVGARQIGKTTAVREFAKKHFECFLELNFLEDPEARMIFETAGNTNDMLLLLKNYKEGTELIPGKTLILLDEIQECPEARTAVKFLVENGAYRYIETGSLLGTRITDIRSIPVGSERLINMYPMTFEEFLWAFAVSEEVIDRMRESFEKREPIPSYLHEQMLRRFKAYLAVGGMPAAVQSFVQKGSLQEVQSILNSIWSLYESDVMKYASVENRTWILEIFKQVPAQLNKPNHRFLLSSVKKGARISAMSDYFSWLTEAGIVLPCFNTAIPQIPLVLNEKRNLFRLYLLDTGLLVSRMAGAARKLLQNDSTINWGAILENAAAQTLVANGFELYYFNSRNIGEIDFLINEEEEVSLIEMKSGRSYQKHPALDKVRSTANWTFRNSYVFSMGNVEELDGIVQMPWYLMMFLHPYKETSDLVFNPETLDFS